jgi:hypothetical protein
MKRHQRVIAKGGNKMKNQTKKTKASNKIMELSWEKESMIDLYENLRFSADTGGQNTIDDEIPVIVESVVLTPIETVIADFKEKVNIPYFPCLKINHDGKSALEECNDISDLVREQLFLKASKPYKWTFSGRKIEDPVVAADYEGYHAELDLSKEKKANLVFKNGKVRPKMMTVYNKDKTLAELETQLNKFYAHLEGLVGNRYACVRGQGSELPSKNTKIRGAEHAILSQDFENTWTNNVEAGVGYGCGRT